MTSSSIVRGRIVSGADDLITTGRHVPPLPQVPVVYCHSASGNPYEAAVDPFRPILNRLARWGFTVVAVDMNQTWGNDDALDAIESGLAHHRASLSGTAAPPLVIGSSMGAAAALRYVMDDGLETPAGALLLIPAIDLKSIYEQDVGSFHDSIGAAWDLLGQGSQTITATGMSQFTVPAGVTELVVEIGGAEGGTGGGGGNGGDGRVVTGTMSVTPGEVLDVYVGTKPSGQNGGSASISGLGACSGGSNGTLGPGPGSGGGAGSGVVTEGGVIADALILAGGGGGASGDASGGGAAPTTMHQIGVTSKTPCSQGTNGGIGQGGGGGGGSGWQGGSGGAANAGGVGGTSAYLPSRFSVAPTFSGVNTGNGYVTFTWDLPLPSVADLLARAAETVAPIYMVVASDDEISTNFATFVSNAGSSVTVDNVGALGHTNAAIAAADVDAILAFIKAVA